MNFVTLPVYSPWTEEASSSSSEVQSSFAQSRLASPLPTRLLSNPSHLSPL